MVGIPEPLPDWLVSGTRTSANTSPTNIPQHPVSVYKPAIPTVSPQDSKPPTGPPAH